ncbi:MAG: ABC transporter ATP-binding protein [Acidimicrobiaceae bacterium]|nr:ABC transporter ATP-binding protein [Acidimicrobiaceae bacterium]
MSPGVVVDHLVVSRRAHPILHGVSLRVAPGELVGLLGPSGSGKSTLMRTLVGVQAFQSGRVLVDDLPVGSPALRDRIGYVAQSPASYRDLTVEENVRYFAAMLGVEARDASRVIDVVDLNAHRHDLVSSLSGGEINRVSLAVALLGAPRLLVLDEPTVGLDPVLRERLWTVFGHLRDQGLAVVVSSHVMDEAARCDRLVLLREGRVIFEGGPDLLLTTTNSSTYDNAFVALVRSAP